MPKKSYSLGIFAESLSSSYLISREYKILYRRYKTKNGEIDIIAVNNLYICFIEVKYRKKINTFECILKKQQSSRIFIASQDFLTAHPEFSSHLIRFEAIFIQQDKSIYHVNNIFL